MALAINLGLRCWEPEENLVTLRCRIGPESGEPHSLEVPAATPGVVLESMRGIKPEIAGCLYGLPRADEADFKRMKIALDVYFNISIYIFSAASALRPPELCPPATRAVAGGALHPTDSGNQF